MNIRFPCVSVMLLRSEFWIWNYNSIMFVHFRNFPRFQVWLFHGSYFRQFEFRGECFAPFIVQEQDIFSSRRPNLIWFQSRQSLGGTDLRWSVRFQFLAPRGSRGSLKSTRSRGARTFHRGLKIEDWHFNANQLDSHFDGFKTISD